MSDLASWRDTDNRRRVLAAIDSAAQAQPDKRIATLDNDGTLWCEKPLYVQASFLFDRWREMLDKDPSLAERQPYKAIAENDEAWLAAPEAHLEELGRGIGEAHAGITPEQFEQAATRFFSRARHPRFATPYASLVYKPMRELLDLLRARGFTVAIAAGGGRDFVRAVSTEIYGVPRQLVIGSEGKLEYSDGTVLRTGKLNEPIDDGPGKPVHIYATLGRPPVIAVGNSDGDIQMLEMAEHAILIHHDDAEREYAYDAGAEKALALAAERDWTVVSMSADFETVF